VLVDGELVAEQGRIVLPTRTRMPAVRIHTPVPG